jgi:uncharacterized protein (DUF427 family)
MWEYRGQKRPPFAEKPAEGQESAWDYPRPPRIEQSKCMVEVKNGDSVIAHSIHAVRVLETASPPTFYIPKQDIDWSRLEVATGHTVCEWKGEASYWQLVGDPKGLPVAWTYPDPYPTFAALREYTSFYPGRIACFVDGERVAPQPGEFYGGWVTADVVGPFKGESGTGHW